MWIILIFIDVDEKIVKVFNNCKINIKDIKKELMILVIELENGSI